MKFLCVDCDEAMSLEETKGPDNGSLTVVFRCGSCGRRTAMLTNAMETQMVHSLGVKVGGRAHESRPMETISDNLSGFMVGPDGVAERVGDAVGTDSADPAGTPKDTEGHADAPEAPKGAGCPFSGAVADQIGSSADCQWTQEAEARMEKIPSFVRGMVRRGIEDVARAEKVERVDVPFIERVRGQMGM